MSDEYGNGSTPGSFDPYEGYSEFSHMGRNYGNPIINMLMGVALGNNYMPFSPSGQSYYDSFMQRENTRNMMGLQNQSFGNNMLFRSMGVSPNGVTGFLGAYAASPDSMLGKIMNPMLGGNPMAASMQLYAGLSGANTMGNFGRQSRISPGETMEIMSTLSDKLYTRQEYEGEGGAKTEGNQKIRDILINNGDGEAGKRYLEDLGYGNLERDEKGNLTEKAKSVIRGLDFFEDSKKSSPEQRGKHAAEMSSTIDDFNQLTGGGTNTDTNRTTGKKLSEIDKEVADRLKARLEHQLQEHKAATKEEIDKAFASGDTSQIAALVARYNTSGEVDTSRVSAEKRAELATQMTTDLEEYSKLPSNSTGTVEQQEKSKQLQAKLTKQLVDNKAATKEEIDKAFSSENPEAIAALVKRYSTSGEINTPKDNFGEEYGRNIRNRITARQVIAGDMQGDLTSISKAESKQEELAKKHEKAKKDVDLGVADADKVLANIEAAQKAEAAKVSSGEASIRKRLEDKKEGLGMSAEEIKKYEDATTGKLDRKKIREFAKTLPDLTPDEQVYMNTLKAKEEGGRYTGFNFANSRGFKLEDFTSAFVRGADLRMFGDQQNMPPAVAMGKFVEHGGGALSAARSLVGNRSGDELMAFINDFAGRSKVDLSSQSGNDEIEDLLRKTKATARVAGVSIKTMLEVIKATKDLASSNPQLQYMSSTANTEMALKAMGTAAVVAGQMRSEDVRAAGGTKGIATREITEKQAYAQSPLGSAKAAWLYNAKSMGADTYKKVAGILDRVKSGRDLDHFGYRELSEAMGINGAQLSTIGNNELMQRYGLQQKDIADKIYGMADTDVVKSFYQGAENYSGLNQKQIEGLFKKHVESGGNESTFTPVMIRYLSREGRDLYEAQKGTINRSLINSLRGEDGQKRFNAVVAQQQQLEKELDKEFAGKNAPVPTQILDAIMKGRDLGGSKMADTMASIFATKDKDSAQVKAIMKNAEDAGVNLSKMSVVATSDKDMLERGMKDEVNKITNARRTQMGAVGDTAGAEKLKNVSNEDLQSLSSLKGIKEASPAKLKAMLKDLREQKAAGKSIGAQNEKVLQGLETLEKTGTIDSANAIRMVQQGDLKGFAAATIQATAEYDIERYKSRKKDVITQGMGKVLTENSELAIGGEIKTAMSQQEYQLEGGKIDWTKMLDDYGHRKKGGKSYFDRMTDEEYKKVAGSALGSQLSQTQDLINQTDSLSSAENVLPDAMGDATKAITDNTEEVKKLNEAINKGGAIADALSGVVSALGLIK